MQYTIDLDPVARVRICPWAETTVTLTIETRHASGGVWHQAGSIGMTAADARGVASALLNMTGQRSALAKRLQWDDDIIERMSKR